MTMKWLGLCILISATIMVTASPGQNLTPPKEAQEYGEFLTKLGTPENLLDFAEKADRLIDAGEKAEEQAGAGENVVTAETKLGLLMEFAVIRTPQAVLYYASLSRKGQMFRYSDAATMIAFFCDRAGLPHPVNIKEGEKPVFHAQWLINPKEWKAMKKKMLEVRAQKRAIKNMGEAVSQAVNEEVSARFGTKTVK